MSDNARKLSREESMEMFGNYRPVGTGLLPIDKELVDQVDSGANEVGVVGEDFYQWLGQDGGPGSGSERWLMVVGSPCEYPDKWSLRIFANDEDGEPDTRTLLWVVGDKADLWAMAELMAKCYQCQVCRI